MILPLLSYIQVSQIPTDGLVLKARFHCFLGFYADPRELDVVTITLKSDPRSFTDSELSTIREQIALLLHQQGSINININIDDVMVEPKSGETGL